MTIFESGVVSARNERHLERAVHVARRRRCRATDVTVYAGARSEAPVPT